MFRFRRGKKGPEAAELPGSAEESSTQEASDDERRGQWSTAFLMAGSALLGATAIAFWNRRTITTLRAELEDTQSNASRGKGESGATDGEIY